jgi:hypothetical protein
MRVSGCKGHYEFVLSAGAPACRLPAGRQGRQESKNRDKQLTHIVRVSGLHFNLIIQPNYFLLDT